jgi:hypothetical protein
MVHHTFVSIHHNWLVVLCAIAISGSLVVPLTTASTGRPLNLSVAFPNNADNDTVDLTEMCDQIEDLAIFAGASFAWLRPVVFLLNDLYLAGQSWLSAPPVRPPIAPN